MINKKKKPELNISKLKKINNYKEILTNDCIIFCGKLKKIIFISI